MKTQRAFAQISVVAAIASMAVPCDGAIRVGNKSRTYAEAYSQVNAASAAQEYYEQQYQSAPAATVQLPVTVPNPILANQIVSGDAAAPVGLNRLQSCAAIYPDGEFAWDTPTGGIGAGGATTCVAVVEMRGLNMGPTGGDVVLARANVAAGDAIKCNISEFPESGYTADAYNIEFPADREPTIEDVKNVMNQEQKQNAGLKIASGLVLFGLFGNMAGQNDPGHDSMLGTDKGKLKSTALYGAGGAALMAASAYTGKEVGDTIRGAGTNAMFGAVTGNMMAATGSDSVLRVEPCVDTDGVTKSCLWGVLVKGDRIDMSRHKMYMNISDSSVLPVKCDENSKNCESVELVGIHLAAYDNASAEDVEDNWLKINGDANLRFGLQTDDNGNKYVAQGVSNDGGIWIEISSASTRGGEVPAAVVGVSDGAFGIKSSDWRKKRRDLNLGDGDGALRMRGSNGAVLSLNADAKYSLNDFYPMKVSAEDGGLIDLGNKARLKDTLVGAGLGGALGGFAAYQGAQSDINDRWVASVRAYKDSLGKVVCFTGRRYLSQYNEVATIPAVNE